MKFFRVVMIAFFCASGGFRLEIVTAQAPANSTRKIRTTPNTMSQRVGLAIRWQEKLDAAQALSQGSGKPIFWYLPSLPGTFMDRKTEIDRYMMAGFFSWPQIIHAINKFYIPLKMVPTKEQQAVLDLQVFKFVEPGFVILAPDGSQLTRIDRLTTQSPRWLLHVLGKFAQNPLHESAIQKLADGFPICDQQAKFPEPDWNIDITQDHHHEFAQAAMLAGMDRFRSNQPAAARRIWSQLSHRLPNHPLAWKAAAEVQGLGPFVRGFETLSPLPDACLDAGLKSSGSTAPANVYSSESLWERGVQFLLGMQAENGGYLDCDYDFGGTDSLPNVHVAVTSLVGLALVDALGHSEPNTVSKIQSAIEQSVRFVCDPSNVNRIDRDEIVWADTYRLQFLCKLHQQQRVQYTQEIQAATEAVQQLQSPRGYWYHEYQNSFVTATALLALFDARQAGARLDATLIDKGVRALHSDRRTNGAFPYSVSRNSEVDAPIPVAAAAGRMPVCELALARWGRSDQTQLTRAIAASFEHHEHLQAALKYDDHTSRYGYGGFFFWYDMKTRCEAILAVSSPQTRRAFQQKQREIVLSLPEIDGCFVDSHELGRCYGTAMALQCLQMTEPHAEPSE